MYFSETPSLREIEKTMKMIPNFIPKGHSVVILCKHEFAEKNWCLSKRNTGKNHVADK